MYSKFINPEANKTMMSKNVHDSLMDRIKNNYVLFGSTNEFNAVIMSFSISKENNPTIYCNNFDKYILTRYVKSNTLDECIALSSGIGSNNYNINKNIITITNYDSYKNIGKNIKTESLIRVELFDDSTMKIDSGIKYYDTDDVAHIQYKTDVYSDGEPFKINYEDEYQLIVLFCNVKSAPIVRVYKNKNDNIFNHILDFTDTCALFSNYKAKSRVIVEETKTTFNSGLIDTMKYREKSKDIFQYLEHENYYIDPDTNFIKYKNDLGVSCETFEERSGEECEEKYVVKYNDCVFYGSSDTYEISAKNKTLIGSEILYHYKLYKDKSNLYLDRNCHKLEDEEDIDNFKKIIEQWIIPDMYTYDHDDDPSLCNFDCHFYSDNNERRLLCSALANTNSYKDKKSLDDKLKYLSSIDAMLIKDKYLYYTFNPQNGYVVCSSLVDLEKGKYIFSIRKEYMNFNKGFTRATINYSDANNLRYNISNIYDVEHGNTVEVFYSGPECTVKVSYDNNGNPILEYLDSLLYSSNDRIIYIRDELGIPCPLSIK